MRKSHLAMGIFAIIGVSIAFIETKNSIRKTNNPSFNCKLKEGKTKIEKCLEFEMKGMDDKQIKEFLLRNNYNNVKINNNIEFSSKKVFSKSVSFLNPISYSIIIWREDNKINVTFYMNELKPMENRSG